MAHRERLRFLLIFAGLILSLVLFLGKVKNEMHDFQVNYTAGQRLDLGETLYRSWKPDPGWESDGHWQFKYSPFSALLYLPLAWLPLAAAKAIWYYLVIFSACMLIFLSLKLASFERGRILPAALISFLVLSKYFLRELQLGQINAVITAILMGMTWSLAKDEDNPSAKDERTAGLFWGLASALKPYALIFLPYFLWKKKWRVLAAGMIVLAVSLCVPIFFYGPRGNLSVIKEWIGSLSQSTPSLFTSQDNVSLLACLVKWTGNGSVAIALFGAIVAALALWTLLFILKGSRLRPSVLAESALLLVFIPLLSPLGWDYTFLSAFPAIVLVLRHFMIFPRFWKALLIADFLIIGFSFYDLMGRHFYARFMAWSVPTICFMIIVSALFYLRLKNAA
jgi:alpha-1,2-mannosyltransferase